MTFQALLNTPLVTGTTSSGSTITIIHSTNQDVSPDEAAFWALLSSFREKYPGLYVAVSNGRFWRAGPSRRALARSFFDEQGEDTPVYIGFIGDEAPLLIPSPMRS